PAYFPWFFCTPRIMRDGIEDEGGTGLSFDEQAKVLGLLETKRSRRKKMETRARKKSSNESAPGLGLLDIELRGEKKTRYVRIRFAAVKHMIYGYHKACGDEMAPLRKAMLYPERPKA